MTNFTRRGALGLMGGAATLPMLGTPALANTKMTVGALRFTSHAASFVALSADTSAMKVWMSISAFSRQRSRWPWRLPRVMRISV